MALRLFIGNKNYSSWSMRPWVLMRQLGIGFEEVALRFDDFGEDSPFKRAVSSASPAGRVPVLVDDGFAVWDSLAIVEYLHESFPHAGVWPADRRDRARARSLCAEMHTGFAALRTHFPMNIEARLADVGPKICADHPDVRADLARIDGMWSERLATSSPMLFGSFGAADAFFAPVCFRIRTYGLPVSGPVRTYVERICQLGSVREWESAALAEHDFVAEDEPYRTAPS